MKSESGELWSMYHGDSRELIKAFIQDGVTFDHSFSDPPFDEGTHSRSSHKTAKNGYRDNEPIKFDPFSDYWVIDDLVNNVVKQWVIMFCSMEMCGRFQDYLDPPGTPNNQKRYIRGGFYRKTNAMCQTTGDRPAVAGQSWVAAHRPGKKRWNGRGSHAYIEHSKAHKSNRPKNETHQHEIPIPVWENIIQRFTNPGDSIFDPYAGSASLGAACIRLNRKYVGCEIDQHNFEMAVRNLRLEVAGINSQKSRDLDQGFLFQQ